MKTIYAEAQPGKVVLKEKEIQAPGKGDRKSTRLNSSHITRSRMPSSA